MTATKLRLFMCVVATHCCCCLGVVQRLFCEIENRDFKLALTMKIIVVRQIKKNKSKKKKKNANDCCWPKNR